MFLSLTLYSMEKDLQKAIEKIKKSGLETSDEEAKKFREDTLASFDKAFGEKEE